MTKINILVVSLVLAVPVFAEPFHTRCFLFPDPSPERQPLSEDATSRWCYTTTDWWPGTLVFRADGELSETSAFLMESTREGKSLTHSSLAYGQMEWFTQSPATFNPFSVPTTVKEALATALSESRMNPPGVHEISDLFFKLKTETRTQVGTSLHIFLEDSQIPQPEQASLPPDKQPWGGYWWPHEKGELFTGERSPLAQYDSFVQQVTGTDPKSVEWEAKYHSLKNVPWGGHCNGWAASTILYPFFDTSYWNAQSGQVVSPDTIQGMRAETSFCVDMAFYGQRYNNAGDDIDDIRPKKFHDVLKYYIQGLGKAVVMDYFPAEWIDNHIISGYEFTYTKNAAGNLEVKAVLNVHGYNLRRINTGPGANKYTKTYRYEFQYDAQGNFVRDRWLSGDHPDFLWVPLAQKKCGRENPRMDPSYIDQLVAQFPEAKQYLEPPVRISTPFTLKPRQAHVLFEGSVEGAEVTAYVWSTLPANGRDPLVQFSFQEGGGALQVQAIPGTGVWFTAGAKGLATVKKIELLNPSNDQDLQIDSAGLEQLSYWNKK